METNKENPTRKPHPAEVQTEVDRKAVAEQPFTTAALLPFLKTFADMYAPAKHERKEQSLTKSARRLLAAKRQWAETSLAEKQYLTGEVAETEANSVDRSFRKERRIASAALNGEIWEVVLVVKNVDLWELLKGMKSKIKSIETIVRTPESEQTECFVPYIALYAERFEQLGADFVTLLQATHSGSCWKVLTTLRKSIGDTYKEIMNIIESEGADVSDETAMTARLNHGKGTDVAEQAEAEKIAA